jgi:CBS domain containing-hemolysin-like protein
MLLGASESLMPPWFAITLAIVLLLLNGFFVASEFALVKVRKSRLEKLVREKKLFARTVQWLYDRMDNSLSACQLGITIASLILGSVAEPAFAAFLRPLLEGIGITSQQVIHGISYTVAISVVTALHLVVGEQAPKIFAIREPEQMALWCAAPLRLFYTILYPFMIVLSYCTTALLRLLGVTGGGGHDLPHSEEEIRTLMSEAHLHGELTRAEHSLLNAVFEFDDQICRMVMVPRNDVIFFNVDQPFAECIEIAKRTKHTRYPLCEGSMDKVVGVVHMKDLVGVSPDQDINLSEIARPPKKVPESMPISRVLRHFQATHQLLALVVDEYGTVAGMVTLENVLEQIVGPVEDEFDSEEPNIVPSGPEQFMVLGSTPIREVEIALGVNLDDEDVDTVSGVLMSRAQKMLAAGDQVKFDGAVADILEVRDDRAYKIRFTLVNPKKVRKGD